MNTESHVFVNAGAIVVIPQALSQARTNDLMNSLLLAQLVASKRLQATPRLNWYDSYVKVLSDFWIASVKAQRGWQPEEHSADSPLEWIAGALASELDDQGRAALASLDSVARLADSLPAMGVLHKQVQTKSKNSRQSNAVRLLVILAQAPSSMSCIFLQFNTRQAVKPNPWGQKFHTRDMDGDVSAHYFQACLAETLFAPARAAIARKVSGVFGDNVADITEAIKALSVEEIGT